MDLRREKTMKIFLLSFFGFAMCQNVAKNVTNSTIRLQGKIQYFSYWNFMFYSVYFRIDKNLAHLSRLKLRVPQDILDYYMSTQTKSSRLKRSDDRQSREINPMVYSCGQQGMGRFSNFVNPNYPGHETEGGTCKFRLITNPNICQVRYTDLFHLSKIK